MLNDFKNFLQRLGSADHTVELPQSDLRLAAAALLVHAVVIDGDTDEKEHHKLENLLAAQYDLSKDETQKLITAAKAEEQDAVDLYGFTSVLTRHLDQAGRRKIVEMLWEIVFADGIEHEFESNLVWRTAELLGVSTHDRIALKQKVRGRIGLD